jgi:hypothetical protein
MCRCNIASQETDAVMAAVRAQTQVALSLLSCFDFDGRGAVSREEWQRGTSILCMEQVGADDALWTKLLASYGSAARPSAVDVARIPERAPLAADPLLMSHVVKALISSIANLSDEVEALKTLPLRVDAQRERMDELGAQTAGQLQALSSRTERLRAQADSHTATRLARALLESCTSTLRPAMRAWAELARQQRETRRYVALSALNPELRRCWERWRRCQSATAERTRAELVESVHARVAERRRVQMLHEWFRWAKEERPRRITRRRSLVLILGRALTHWASHTRGSRAELAAAAAAAVKRANATLDGAKHGRPSASVGTNTDKPPPYRVPSPPPPVVRAGATGWHRDLSLYGTALSARDERSLRDAALATSEQQRITDLERQLAVSEARASVLERRQGLRPKERGDPLLPCRLQEMEEGAAASSQTAIARPQPPQVSNAMQSSIAPFAEQSQVRGPKHALTTRTTHVDPYPPAPMRPRSALASTRDASRTKATTVVYSPRAASQAAAAASSRSPVVRIKTQQLESVLAPMNVEYVQDGSTLRVPARAE